MGSLALAAPSLAQQSIVIELSGVLRGNTGDTALVTSEPVDPSLVGASCDGTLQVDNNASISTPWLPAVPLPPLPVIETCAASAPVPVLVRLASWTDPAQNLASFLVDALGPFGGDLEALVADGRALLLLDGLNEIPAAGRSRDRLAGTESVARRRIWV